MTAADLINEATAWGIRRRAAAAVMAKTLDRVLAAIPAAHRGNRVLAIIREPTERISLG